MDFNELRRSLDGNWRKVIEEHGIKLPTGRNHGPCPKCGGEDRFRFDDKNGRGTWFCSGGEHQKSGDAIDLLRLVFNWTLGDALRELNKYLGAGPRESLPSKPAAPAVNEPSPQEVRDAFQRNLATILNYVEHGHCDYLRSKGFGDVGVMRLRCAVKLTLSSKRYQRFPAGTTILRLFNNAGECVAAQGIYPDPDNPGRFLKRAVGDSAKKGAFKTFGRVNPELPFVLAEGFSTGYAISRFLPRCNVLMAVDAGNLVSVALGLHERFPAASFVICPDNDEAGRLGALKALQEVPGVSASWPIEEGLDWDDVYHQKGECASRRELLTQRPDCLAELKKIGYVKQLAAAVEHTPDRMAVFSTCRKMVEELGRPGGRAAYQYLAGLPDEVAEHEVVLDALEALTGNCAHDCWIGDGNYHLEV
ncbi:hypothetical protein EAN04_24470 [Salmonella enterica]|nr:hypothetical protein [Salmonella enterica]